MTWYKTGTVAVTVGSNAVIGTGTSFIANSRVGDGFRGPDGGWYEITNIASDTAMSIAPAYGSPSAYSIAPLQGYLKDSADALRAATMTFAGGVADMDEQVAVATEAAESAAQSKAGATEQASIATSAAATSTNNKDAAQLAAQQSSSSAQASGAAADRAETAKTSIIQSEQAAAASAQAAAASAAHAEEVTLGKAASGANSDITSLSGLTTPLSVDQGGNGGTSTPYLPSASANQTLNNRRFSTQDTWTGSPFAGTDSRNFGYLDHWNWTNNDQQIQRWISLDRSVPPMIRYKVGGAWDSSWTLAVSSSVWGSITGTLSAQTDLSNALAAKLTGSASQLATAWINFNGQGTVAIRSGYNVSLTKVSTGVYRITFLTPMNNATYVVTQAFASDAPTSVDNFSSTTLPRSMYVIESEKTVNSFMVRCGYNSASASAVLDFSSVNLTVMGGK